MTIHVILLALLVACTAQYTGNVALDGGSDDRTPEGDAGAVDASADAMMVSLSPTPGRYRGTCDGSAAVALDFDHFAGFSDADQRIRVFARGADGPPLASTDIGSALALSGSQADFEDVERVDNRIYAISSHGRKNNGELDLDRYRFVAITIGGSAPSFTFAVAGSRSTLLSDMLAAANWTTPNQAVIDALKSASRLGTVTDPNLAPKSSGVNIEGLARAPIDGNPQRMVIGLRNPRPGGRAIIVSLLNPDAVIGNATAQLGEAFTFDFGNGLGVRGMTWSPVLQQVLILAGPHDDSSGPFKLYRWAGTPGSAPTMVMNVNDAPGAMKPEGLVTYPSTYDVEIVLDADDQQVGGVDCDDAPTDQRSFSDLILRVEATP